MTFTRRIFVPAKLFTTILKKMTLPIVALVLISLLSDGTEGMFYFWTGSYTSDIYFQFGMNMHKSDLVHWQRGNTEMN